MIQFDLIRPQSIEEACDFLNENVEESKIKAAGISLLILLKQNLFRPKYLINLEGIPGLRYVKEGNNGSLCLGPLTTHRDVETSPVIAHNVYILKEMVLDLGSVQVRNRGTVGGCLCHSEPLSDVPPVMVALGGEAKCVSVLGKRTIPFADFFLDYYETALRPSEILTEITIPKIPPRTGCAYIKHTLRKAMDKPYVAVAVYLQLENQEPVCRDVRVVLGAIGPTPFRARQVEQALLKQRINESVIDSAAEQMSFDGIDIVYDMRCPEEYKKDVSPVIIKRAIKTALNRAVAG